MRGHVAGGHDAQVIADKSGHPLILEDAGVLAENRTGSRVFDVGLDGHHAFATALVENLVNQLEYIEVIGMGKA